MTETGRKPSKARVEGQDREAGPDGPDGPPGAPEVPRRLPALDGLLTAAAGLAGTIAATEQLAQQRADILTRRTTLLGPARDSRLGGRVISLAEAARRTGRHPEVLRRWCLEGRIEAVRIGRTWAITPQTLALLLAHSGRSRPRFPNGSA